MPSLPAGAAWLYALKTCMAAFLALYIALLTPLDRPGWAVTTVFIASQAQSGATVSKSVYRFLGTLLGAAATVVMVPNLVNSPELLSVALSAWVAGCLYLSLQDRTPRSYIFMLAGYSAAFIGFPAVDTPGNIFDLALARVEEITLGVICSSVVHSIVLPVKATAAFEARLQQWLGGVRQWVSTRTQASVAEAKPGELAPLSAHLAAMQGLAHHAGFDLPGTRGNVTAVARINDLVALGFPLMAAVDRRLAKARAEGFAVPERVAAVMAQLHRSAASREAPAWSELDASLRDTLHALKKGTMTLAGLHWVSTVTLLLELVRLLRRLERLRKDVKAGRTRRYRYRLPVRRHVERRLAVLSSLTTFAAMLLGCAFWIGAGWPSGSSVPMIAAVCCSFFATMDNPLPPMKVFGQYVVVADIITVIYSTVILPDAQSFEMAVLALFPVFMVLGIMMATPSTAFIGMVLSTNVATLLGLNNQYVSDFAGTVNGAIATLGGVILTMVVVGIVRTRTPAWSAKQLLRAGLSDLHRTLRETPSRRHRRLHRDAFVARMVDRLHAVLPRLRPGTLDDVALEADLSTELRVGVNALELQKAVFRDSPGERRDTGLAVLDGMTAFVARRSKHLGTRPDDELHRRIDTALAAATADDARRWDMAVPLYNLRLTLFA